jgi:hypothetical protein
LTDFERAMVAAFLARKEHGEWSPQYQLALLEMEAQRPESLRARANRCAWCGKTSGHWNYCARPGDQP